MQRLSQFLILSALLLAPLSSQKVYAYPDTAVSTVALSVQPQAAIVGPTDRYIYILDTSAGAISIVDTLFFREHTTATFSGTPRDFSLSTDGQTLFVLAGAADRVTTLDVSDAINDPTELDEIDLGTSGITFDRIVTSGDVLVLLRQSDQEVYLYNVAQSALVNSGAQTKIELDFTPKSVAVTPDGSRLGVVAQDGTLEMYSTSTLAQLDATVDLGDLAATEDFLELHLATISSGTYGFVSNSIATGELFLLDLTVGNTITVQDANPANSTVDPVEVGVDPSAILVTQVNRSEEDADASGTYVYVANRTDDTLSVIDAGTFSGSEEIEPFTSITSVSDVPSRGLIASSVTDGYVYALSRADSAMTVVTDQPWIRQSSDVTVENGIATVSLTSNVSGTLTAIKYTGEDTEIISMSLGKKLFEDNLVASVEKTFTFSTSDFEEGDTPVVFFVEDDDRIGRLGVDVTVDTVPDTPSNFEVTFGNEKIIARWDRVSVSDLSHYLVYFGTPPDASGGITGLTSPQRLDQTSGRAEYVIEPVANGTKLYVRVVAVDENGNQSASTEILSDTAEATIGILGRFGDTGGCQSNGMFPLILFGFALMLYVFRNRSVLPVLFLMWIVPNPAHAETIQKATEPEMVGTSIEFRVGWWLPKETVMEDFFGKSGNEIYMLRFGFLWNNFDFGIESGISSEKAALLGVTSGRTSGEGLRSTIVPTEISAQYSLRWSPRQIIVPFGRFGYDILYYRISEPTDRATGFKNLITFTGGIRFMLERLGRSNDVQEFLGLKHFFVEAVASYRYQISDGIDFGGWIFQPGIGIEF